MDVIVGVKLRFKSSKMADILAVVTRGLFLLSDPVSRGIDVMN